ncbi:MAG: hypothetical protein KME31_27815 [Tolypothrix carrinoi HA7290-LM1]|jgi:hypothetical protein|nr:hypothetical protein [Tolypothrix carrinoi HA7290-LM1]
MAQARIVVRDEALERGQELLKATKLGSLTELFNVLVSRYGTHLQTTWVIPATSCLCSSVQPKVLPGELTPKVNEIEETNFDGELTGV